MNSQTTPRLLIVPLALLLLPGAVFAADADNAAKRTFAFCDKNSDGRLDAAELDGIPVSMRDWLAKSGPKSKTGLTQAEFVRVYPKMMADLRTQTRVASSRGTSTTSAATADPQPMKTTSSSAKSNPPLYASTPPSDDIVETIPPSNLPSSYQESDLDKDGQIDYFEWRKAKLGDFAKFQGYDLNNDSILSPQELAAGGVAVGSSSAGTGNGSTEGSTSTASAATSAPAASSGPSEEYLKQVRYYFYYMDGQGEKYNGDPNPAGNKNGVLDPSEWNASKRIKPAFEKAGIDITKPMDEKTFIVHYGKIFPEVKKQAPKTGFRLTPGGGGASTPGGRTTGRRRRGR